MAVTNTPHPVLPTAEERPLLTVLEAVEAIRPGHYRTRSGAYRAAKKLPTVRIGGNLYVKTAELRALVGLPS